jgi:hypothetical protein
VADSNLLPLARSVSEVLLPRTDAGVLVQMMATLILAPIVLVIVTRRNSDVGWLAGGLIALWIAWMGLRALH